MTGVQTCALPICRPGPCPRRCAAPRPVPNAGRRGRHLSQRQDDTLFVFDEPTIGLHPLDVKVLVHVMQKLLDQGATIITITHDLNLIVNTDYMLDLGPRGGENGGKLVAKGRPLELIKDPQSLTVKYLADYVDQFKLNKINS